MATGYIRWYRDPMLEYDFANQLQRMRELGCTFAEVDEKPEQPPLAERIATADDLTLHLRPPSGPIVPVRFSRLRPDLLLQVYLLTGSLAETDVVEAVLWDAYRRNLASTRALVIDRVGHARTVPWDDVVLRGGGAVEPLPDVVLLREESDPPTPFTRFTLIEHRPGG
jgi:hypothetical protein